MQYEYRIYEEVYNDMISGKKTIEYRILNEKSKKINIGDKIKFNVVNNENKYIITQAIDKFIYDNMEELWKSSEIKNNILGYDKEKLIETFYKIFTKEKVDYSKIVGFKFKVISS